MQLISLKHTITEIISCLDRSQEPRDFFPFKPYPFPFDLHPGPTFGTNSRIHNSNPISTTFNRIRFWSIKMDLLDGKYEVNNNIVRNYCFNIWAWFGSIIIGYKVVRSWNMDLDSTIGFRVGLRAGISDQIYSGHGYNQTYLVSYTGLGLGGFYSSDRNLYHWRMSIL